MSIFLTFPTPHIMVFPPRVERPGPIGPRQTPWAASVVDGMIAAAGDWHRSRFSVNCDKIESLFSTESEGRKGEKACYRPQPRRRLRVGADQAGIEISAERHTAPNMQNDGHRYHPRSALGFSRFFPAVVVCCGPAHRNRRLFHAFAARKAPIVERACPAPARF